MLLQIYSAIVLFKTKAYHQGRRFAFGIGGDINLTCQKESHKRVKTERISLPHSAEERASATIHKR